MNRLFDRVIVRKPGESYQNCVSTNPSYNTIDLKKAANQHQKYVKTLQNSGIKVTRLKALEKYPDSTFIQDTALVGEDSNTAVINRFGQPTRRGEEISVKEYLTDQGFSVKEIKPPGTLEGGDILVSDRKTLFVGISQRTNEEGVNQLSNYFPQANIVPVPVSEVFHLLSAVNFIGNNTLVICPKIIDKGYFSDFNLIEVPAEELYATNMLFLGDKKVLISDGYSRTETLLTNSGYSPIKIDISEFWKGDGGVTCLNLPFYKNV